MATTTSTAPRSHNDQTVVQDADISRCRICRAVAAVIIFTLTFLVCATLGATITSDWFNYAPAGFFLGLMAATWIFFSILLPRMHMTVGLNKAFLTIDLLWAFLGFKDVYRLYGPGDHLTFLWENREKENYISLDEASEDFELEIITKTGKVKVKGSYRIRPRFGVLPLVAFRGSVAVVASNIVDLVKSFITTKLTAGTIESSLSGVAQLNEDLHDHFGLGNTRSKHSDISDLEDRFGLVVGDVTVATVELPPDVEKTLSGLAEVKMTNRGTAMLLGLNDDVDATGNVIKTAEVKLEEALHQKKTVTPEDMKLARDRYLAMTGNITMDLKAQEFTLKVETPPDLAQGLGAIAPALFAWVEANKANKQGDSKSKGKKK